MNNLTRFTAQDAEVVIDIETGEAFTTQVGYANIVGLSQQTVNRRCNRNANLSKLKIVSIDLGQGLQTYSLIPAMLMFEWLLKDKPELAIAMGNAGATIFLHQLAGFKISSQVTAKNETDCLKEVKDLRQTVQGLQQAVQELQTKLGKSSTGDYSTPAPGWNPELWKRLSYRERWWHWKQYNKYGWLPSDQQNETEVKQLAPAVEIEAKLLQQEELSKLMPTATEDESERIKQLRQKALESIKEVVDK